MTDYQPNDQDRQRLAAAQQIRADINALLASETRRPALYADIRNRLREALTAIEEVLRHYEKGE